MRRGGLGLRARGLVRKGALCQRRGRTQPPRREGGKYFYLRNDDDRGIDAAEGDQAGAVVIRLDTPGGLSTSMDDIIKRLRPVTRHAKKAAGRAGKEFGRRARSTRDSARMLSCSASVSEKSMG